MLLMGPIAKNQFITFAHTILYIAVFIPETKAIATDDKDVIEATPSPPSRTLKRLFPGKITAKISILLLFEQYFTLCFLNPGLTKGSQIKRVANISTISNSPSQIGKYLVLMRTLILYSFLK